MQIIEKKPTDTASPKKQRIAAYCRVSTPLEEQQSSLKLQIDYYTEYIKGNNNWIFAGIYADTVSGLTAKDRPQLQKLIRKCKAGKVDLILCKSVSRFARNLRETLNILDELKSYNVGVWFDDIKTNSLDPKVFSALTIYGLHAQEEIERRSKYIKEGGARYNSKGLTGLIVCGECGRNYRRVARKRASGTIYVWRCANRQESGNKICKNSPTVSEEEMKQKIMDELGIDEWDEKLVRKNIRRIFVSNGGILKIESFM